MLAVHPGKFLLGQCMSLSVTVPDDIFKYCEVEVLTASYQII